MASEAADFIRKYPVDLRAIINSPLVFRENVPFLFVLPEVTQNGMRELAEFAGYSYGALRTALSRARSAGDVDYQVGKDGVTRYRLTKMGKSVSTAVKNRPKAKGYTVAIFAFKTEEDKERKALREALYWFGFTRFAQNSYITARMDSAAILEKLRELGVEENVFIFQIGKDLEPGIREKLARAFGVENRAAVLREFLSDSLAFLEFSGLPRKEAALRMLYYGPVHHRLTFTEEPPIPADCLPEDYPLAEVAGLPMKVFTQQIGILADYMKEANAR